MQINSLQMINFAMDVRRNSEVMQAYLTRKCSELKLFYLYFHHVKQTCQIQGWAQRRSNITRKTYPRSHM